MFATNHGNQVAWALVCVAAGALVSPLTSDANAPKSADASTIVHLSCFTDNLHKAFMAVKAANWIQGQGQNVVLFVDVEGARLADARYPLDVRWGTADTKLSDLYQQFITAGGTVLVCPHCAKAAGIEDGSLRDGAKIGTEEELAHTLASCKKILDY
jgi:predicted peroxiredoxin